MDDILKNVAIDDSEGAPGAGVIGTNTASATPKATAGTGSTGGTGGSGGSGGGSSEEFLTFTPFEDRVYRASDTHQITDKMSYTVKDNVKLIDATWLSRASESQDFELLAKTDFPSEIGGQARREAPFFSVSYDEVGFDLSWFRQPNGSSFLEKSLQLQIGWEMDDVAGSTTSGLFAVVNNASPGFIESINSRLKSEMDKDTALQGTQTISSSGSQRTGDSRTGEGGAPNASQSSLPDSSSSKGSGGGGLSIGAKAGIGVGAALGALLIIGLLVWFLLRRRRQKKQLDSGYNGQQSSNTYMVDKETQGRVTESPTSPYSDENQGQRVPLTDIETARETPATHAPYEDTPAPRSSLGSHNERGSGTQTPQGVSTNVAHLVEEGMTAEEIRRLEEEERQLDDEIERAARR